jgi:hypothetical protein
VKHPIATLDDDAREGRGPLGIPRERPCLGTFGIDLGYERPQTPDPEELRQERLSLPQSEGVEGEMRFGRWGRG